MDTLPNLPCMCASLRRLTRAVTQLYDDELRPANLRSTQFTVLQALSLAGDVTQATLGEILAMDSTTLTRTLDILIREGWVVKVRGEDRREWRIGLTGSGKAKLRHAEPFWQKAQTRLQAANGSPASDDLRSLIYQLTNALKKEKI